MFLEATGVGCSGGGGDGDGAGCGSGGILGGGGGGTFSFSWDHSHHPAVILGFFGGEKKVRQEKSYEKFYRENVPEKPLRTHHDKLSNRIPGHNDHRGITTTH